MVRKNNFDTPEPDLLSLPRVKMIAELERTQHLQTNELGIHNFIEDIFF